MANLKDINDLFEFDDPINSMREDFIEDLRRNVAAKKIQISQWVPRVLLDKN